MIREPVRIQIHWERMKELLSAIEEDVSDINTEKELNDFMGNGRSSFSCSKHTLYAGEIIALYDSGFQDKYDGDIVMIVEKETYPGIYMIGEF